MRRTILLLSVATFALTACKEMPGRDKYRAGEVGVSRAIEFGRVLNVREVDIVDDGKEGGALLGAGGGAIAGSTMGKGNGSTWAALGGAVVGAVAGHYAQHAINDRTGLEYTIEMQSGEVKTIVQEKEEGVKPVAVGKPVMLQYCDAGNHAGKCREGRDYQRVIAVAKLPPYVKVKRKFVQTKEVDGYENYKPERGGDADFELTPLSN